MYCNLLLFMFIVNQLFRVSVFKFEVGNQWGEKIVNFEAFHRSH